MSENFTQSDLQDIVSESITRHAIGLALQAQKIFVFRNGKIESCQEDSSKLCSDNGDGTFTVRLLTQSDGDGNALDKSDICDTLTSKYGFTKEEILKGPTDCFDANDKQQLTNPFEKGLPADPKAPCVFNILTCNVDAPTGEGITDRCRAQGLDI